MIEAQEKARLNYYLKEMRDKFTKHPESLCLRNGIAAIEAKLGLPQSVAPCDPLEYIDNLEKSQCD